MKRLLLFSTLVSSFILSSLAFMHYKINIKSLYRSNRSVAMKSTSQSVPAHKRTMVLVPVANGSEELETVTIVDTLIRGGACVTLAAVNSPTLQVRCSRGISIVADRFISDCLSEEWDMIVCPGGMPGAQVLSSCFGLKNILTKQDTAERYIAAICAAPAVVLAHGQYGKDHKMTCYPAPKFTEQLGSNYVSDERVVVDRHVITSQGPGTALEFSLKLVEILFGEEKARQVQREMVA